MTELLDSDNKIRWWRCSHMRRALPLLAIPLGLFPALFLPELSRNTLLGDYTAYSFPLNATFYFAGAYLALGVLADLYRWKSRWWILIPAALLGPFLGLELFFVGLICTDMIARAGVNISIVMLELRLLLFTPPASRVFAVRIGAAPAARQSLAGSACAVACHRRSVILAAAEDGNLNQSPRGFLENQASG